MLVLSRKPGEAIVIGGGIRLRVLEVRGNHVRLGVEAPAEVNVVREELHRAVVAANRQSARVDDRSAALVASRLRARDREEGR